MVLRFRPVVCRDFYRTPVAFNSLSLALQFPCDGADALSAGIGRDGHQRHPTPTVTPGPTFTPDA